MSTGRAVGLAEAASSSMMCASRSSSLALGDAEGADVGTAVGDSVAGTAVGASVAGRVGLDAGSLVGL